MADNGSVTFSQKSAERIDAVVGTVERGSRGGGGGGGGRYGGGGGYHYIAKSRSGGIAAMSGSTPGSATVDIYALDGSGVLAATGDAFTAYNMGSDAVGGTKFIQLIWAGGGLFVAWENC